MRAVQLVSYEVRYPRGKEKRDGHNRSLAIVHGHVWPDNMRNDHIYCRPYIYIRPHKSRIVMRSLVIHGENYCYIRLPHRLPFCKGIEKWQLDGVETLHYPTAAYDHQSRISVFCIPDLFKYSPSGTGSNAYIVLLYNWEVFAVYLWPTNTLVEYVLKKAKKTACSSFEASQFFLRLIRSKLKNPGSMMDDVETARRVLQGRITQLGGHVLRQSFWTDMAMDILRDKYITTGTPKELFEAIEKIMGSSYSQFP